MSRTNPYKKKRRAAKKTALLYCEGADDKAFLKYLKTLFAKDSGIAITIKESYGGGANKVLSDILKQLPADIMICIYDIDKEVNISLKQKVKNQRIICIENNPCLEAFLLAILEEKDYSFHQKCNTCKREFENKYLDKKKRKDKENYTKNFPKELLTKRAKTIKNLKILIDVISGKYKK